MEFLHISQGSEHAIPASDETVIFSQLESERIKIAPARPSFKYVVSGSEIYHIGPRRIILAPGDFLYVGAGQTLEVETRPNMQTEGWCVYVNDAEFSEMGISVMRSVMPAPYQEAARDLSARAKTGQINTNLVRKFISDFQGIGKKQTRHLKQLSGRIKQVRTGTKTDNVYRLELGRQFIVENVHQPLNLDQLSSVCGLSKYHFCRLFRQAYGVSPMKFHAKKRMDSAARHLETGNQSVFDVAAEFGFSDASSFTKAFKSYFDVSPGHYKKARMDMVAPMS